MMGSFPDIVLTAVVFLSLPACFVWPWVGIVVWCWLGFMNPHRLMHGFAPDMHFSQLVAIATLAGLPFTGSRYRLPLTREVVLLLAFWGVTVLSTFLTAIHPPEARHHFLQVTKILVMNVFLVVILFQERRKIFVLLGVMALSLGVYAVTGAAWALATGSSQPIYGPPNSQIYDTNNLAGALVLLLPLVAFLHRHTSWNLVRFLLAGTFVANALAIQATFSRAGLIGAFVVGVGLLLSRYFKLLGLAAGVLLLLFVGHRVPSMWTSRMATITTVRQTATTDASAIVRLHAWYVAWRLGCDHPWLGAGYLPFAPEVYEKYIPGYSDYHYAHNIFLQVFAEHGVPGLLLYGALLVCTLLTLQRIATQPRHGPDDEWLSDAARAVQLALVGYATVSMFHCLSYTDLLFQCVALAIVLDVVARSAQQPVAALLRRPGGV